MTSWQKILIRERTILATGTQATGTLATGTQATGTLATGTLATGTLATGTLATGTLATGTLATGTLATGTLATGIAPIEKQEYLTQHKEKYAALIKKQICLGTILTIQILMSFI